MPVAPAPGVGRPAVLDVVDAPTWARLTLGPRVIAPADPATAHALVLAAIRDGARVSAAVEGATVVGAAVSRQPEGSARTDLLALGVAPAWRRAGLGHRLLAANVAGGRPGDVDHAAEVTLAERDVVEPLDRLERAAVARRLLDRAGFRVAPADPALRGIDPLAIVAERSALPVGD